MNDEERGLLHPFVTVVKVMPTGRWWPGEGPGSSAWVRSAKGSARIPVRHLKATREALAAAQSALIMAAQRGVSVDALEGRLARLQVLIDEIDVHRPLDPDGKHGSRHTKTCGCD